MIKEAYCWNWNATKATRMSDGKVFTREQIAHRLQEAQESMGECEIEFFNPITIVEQWFCQPVVEEEPQQKKI
jgi:uncharacterized Fe-S cluster-containing radical SAM superfamily protein